MTELFVALIPALFWGILPLYVMFVKGSPIQQIVGTTIGTLIFALVWGLLFPVSWTWQMALLAALSGACWTIGQINQYRAFHQIGVAQAMPISTGMQIGANVAMGMFIFHQWQGVRLLGVSAVLLILLGVGLISYSKSETTTTGPTSPQMMMGIRTLLWSTLGYTGYSFIPQYYAFSPLASFLPQAVGMCLCALVLAICSQPRLILTKCTLAHLVSGLIFAIAALAYLFSIHWNGIATAFSLSQMCVVVATLGGFWVLKEPLTATQKYRLSIGMLFIVGGGVLIGYISAL